MRDNIYTRHENIIEKSDDVDLRYFGYVTVSTFPRNKLILLDLFYLKCFNLTTDKEIQSMFKLLHSSDKDNVIVAEEIHKVKLKEFKRIEKSKNNNIDDINLNYKSFVFKPFQDFINKKVLDGVLDKIVV
jgi:hypothetical protein